MQVGELALESRWERRERQRQPAPVSQYAGDIPDLMFDTGEETQVSFAQKRPSSNRLLLTYPDDQYDDDIEAEGSHGMEAKHGQEYVNGMMGNEELQGAARVGGSAVTFA